MAVVVRPGTKYYKDLYEDYHKIDRKSVVSSRVVILDDLPYNYKMIIKILSKLAPLFTQCNLLGSTSYRLTDTALVSCPS